VFPRSKGHSSSKDQTITQEMTKAEMLKCLQGEISWPSSGKCCKEEPFVWKADVLFNNAKKGKG